MELDPKIFWKECKPVIFGCVDGVCAIHLRLGLFEVNNPVSIDQKRVTTFNQLLIHFAPFEKTISKNTRYLATKKRT
jgi:hypothetical protein